MSLEGIGYTDQSTILGIIFQNNVEDCRLWTKHRLESGNVQGVGRAATKEITWHPLVQWTTGYNSFILCSTQIKPNLVDNMCLKLLTHIKICESIIVRARALTEWKLEMFKKEFWQRKCLKFDTAHK